MQTLDCRQTFRVKLDMFLQQRWTDLNDDDQNEGHVSLVVDLVNVEHRDTQAKD